MTAHAYTAALLIMNAYGLAPIVAPYPPGALLVGPRETVPMQQLTNYMGRFTELGDSLHAWQPFTVYADPLEVIGVTLSPWLAGGANYLRATLKRLGHDLPAPEWVPCERWIANLEALHDAYLDDADRDVYAVLSMVRGFWDAPSGLVSTSRLRELLDYWQTVQSHVARLGLETSTSRIRDMKRRATAPTLPV